MKKFSDFLKHDEGVSFDIIYFFMIRYVYQKDQLKEELKKMVKLKKVLGLGVVLAGSYYVADKYYPTEVNKCKKELSNHYDKFKNQIVDLKDTTVNKSQDIVGVAQLATDETKQVFSMTQSDIVKSIKGLKENITKVVEDTKGHLADNDKAGDAIETLVSSVKEIKDELSQSFEEILNTFSGMKDSVSETADIAVEMSKEVVSDEE